MLLCDLLFGETLFETYFCVVSLVARVLLCVERVRSVMLMRCMLYVCACVRVSVCACVRARVRAGGHARVP